MDILEQILNPILGPTKGYEMDVETRDVEPGDMLLVPALIERPGVQRLGPCRGHLREQDRLTVTLLAMDGQRVRLKGWADDWVRIERAGRAPRQQGPRGSPTVPRPAILNSPTQRKEPLMEHEDYNGWRNRETWALVLHINNDQGLQAWATSPKLVAEHGTTAFNRVGEQIVDGFQEMVEEAVEEGSEQARWAVMVLRDVGSFWRIDWAEVGESFIEAIDA